MILNEILNTKFTDFKEDHDEKNNFYETEAKIGDRTIHFYADWFHFKQDGGKKYAEIEFSESKEDTFHANGRTASRRTYKLTGSGNEFAVFAFIKQSIMQFIKLEDPDVIKFTSLKGEEAGANRSRLYLRLFKRELANFEIKKTDDGTKQIKFTLEKRK